MDNDFLEKVLQKILLASVAGPVALSVGCGGRAYEVQNTQADSGQDAVAADDSGGDDGGFDASNPVDAGNPDAGTDAPACETVGSPMGYCDVTYTLVGDPNSCGLTVNGPNPPALCDQLCREHVVSCSLVVLSGGYEVACNTGPCGTGRRPDGLAQLSCRKAATGAGRYFAQAAYLEAASVKAFRNLRAELSAHGAPRRLLRAAERAARDEVRHARVTSALARRYGATAAKPRVARRRARSLEALAVENAVEGCVRETFGALMAMWQARAAGDLKVRAAMAKIASDETRHATLGWQVAAWVEAKLDAAGRDRVATARRTAIRELHAELGVEPDAELSRVAGLPSAAQARTLLEGAGRSLWSGA
jgi:hypothetical protein